MRLTAVKTFGERLQKFSQSALYNPTETEIETGLFSRFGLVLRQALIAAGILFTILFLWAAYLWMTAQGNEEQVKRARNIFTAAIVGMMILSFSAAITYTISYFLIASGG